MESSSSSKEETLATFHILRSEKTYNKQEDEDGACRSLLVPDPCSLPPVPPSAVEANFVRYYAVGKILNPNSNK